MFYLIQSLNIIKKHLFLTFCYAILTLVLFFSVVNFSNLQEKINHLLPKVENELYMNTLVDSKVNIGSLIRKVGDLPGVKKVNTISSIVSSKQITKLEKELKLSKGEVTELRNMIGLHVVLDYQVSQSSLNLIREYMMRLTGKNKIIIGEVQKKITKEKIFKTLVANVKRWPLQISIGIAFIFWMISYLLLRKELVRHSYIIESFQRRNNVALKISLTLSGINISLSALVSLLFFIPNLYAGLSFIAAVYFLSLSLNGKMIWARS